MKKSSSTTQVMRAIARQETRRPLMYSRPYSTNSRRVNDVSLTRFRYKNG